MISSVPTTCLSHLVLRTTVLTTLVGEIRISLRCSFYVQIFPMLFPYYGDVTLHTRTEVTDCVNARGSTPVVMKSYVVWYNGFQSAVREHIVRGM